jgi:hypothetical protein
MKAGRHAQQTQGPISSDLFLYAEISNAVKIDVKTLGSLAETFERAGAKKQQDKVSALEKDLNDLQRLAIEARALA